MNWLKYISVFRLGWEAGFVYRLNFVMWRIRTVIQLLTVYFLWLAVLKDRVGIFGYTGSALLTYVVLASLVRAVVLASRSADLQTDISNGDLNNYLTRPINVFGYWLMRDIADKILNIGFAVFEIGLIWIILKPPIIPPATLTYGLVFLGMMLLALLLYFCFSLVISLSVFWMPEGAGWPQRFFVFVMLEFLAGGLFPLDILPGSVYAVISRLPTAFMLSMPIQTYLGRISFTELPEIILWMVSWLAILYITALWLYARGLKKYGAYGR